MRDVINVVEKSSKSWFVAILLCIFFGYLGIHRFYVGKVGTGVIYILTGGLFGIGWMFDLITIAGGNFTDANGSFLMTSCSGKSSKKWLITVLLCGLLGWLGVHRFYVGKVGTGILYLLTGGLFGIGWIVDLIIILSGNFSDSNGKNVHVF
jgi:TM2 domain-containing membrane protein YozV